MEKSLTTMLAVQATQRVRQAIGKVKLATKESYDDLEIALLDVLETNIDSLGDSFEQVQEESDKALLVARTRIDEQAAKEEAASARPRELMDEFGALSEALDVKVRLLKDAANLKEGGTEDSVIDDVSAVHLYIQEVETAIKAFAKECADLVAKNSAVIRELASLPSIKKEWAELAKNLNVSSQEAEKVIVSAKKAVKGQLLARALPEMREKIAELSGPMEAAEEAVVSAERAVEPFVKPKGDGLDELSSTAVEVEESIERAQQLAFTASQAMEVLLGDAKKTPEADVQAFMLTEVKLPKNLLGRLENRLSRAANLMRRYRREMHKKNNPGAAAAKGSAKVKQPAGEAKVGHGAAVAAAEEALGKVAKLVELLDRLKGEDPSKLEALAGETQEIIEAAKTSMVTFTKFVAQNMRVVKGTPLTEGLAVAGATMVRQLRAGELVQVLEGPTLDGQLGLRRVRVRTVRDGGGIIGWATVAGNAGSVFLKPCPAPN